MQFELTWRRAEAYRIPFNDRRGGELSAFQEF